MKTHDRSILGGLSDAPSSQLPKASLEIGVFDSGLGGLSVLRALQVAMPNARFLYVADSAFAPYGERDVDEVVQRSMRITEFLIARGSSGVVVACNTATAAAISAMRAKHPKLPLVGIEPGLKPAVAASRNGRIGVMATPATLASQRFEQLHQAQAQSSFVLRQACPGLADLIEQGDLNAPGVIETVQRFCEPLRRAEVDTVVLGCTHYPLVAHHIQAALGADVQLIDTAHAVARHAAQHFGLASIFDATVTAASVTLLTTGNASQQLALETVAGLCLTMATSAQQTDLTHAAVRAA
jgi:glutamate racemase